MSRLFLALILSVVGVFGCDTTDTTGSDGQTQDKTGSSGSSVVADPVIGPNGWSYEDLAALSQTLRRLPPGDYMVGDDRPDEYANRSPRHPVEIGEVVLGNVPVLNVKYLKFVDNLDGYNKREFWTEEGWTWRNEFDIVSPAGWDEIAENIVPEATDASLSNNYPVAGVSFYEATAFARSLGCLESTDDPSCQYRSKRYENGTPVRLPTEQEFEVASSLMSERAGASASGDCESQNTRYPWGEDYEPGRVVNSGAIRPVGVADGMARCVGLLDVKGNVLQWTKSDYEPYPGSTFVVPETNLGWKVARGSDFRANDAIREITARTPLQKNARIDSVGFRLAIEDLSYIDCMWSDLRLDCPYRG